MTEVPQVRLPRPYLIFVGDARSAVAAKTGGGVYHWAPEACTAQWRLGEDAYNIGLPDMRPAEAVAAGAKSLLIGVAPVGGKLPAHWVPCMIEALEAGLDLVSGLHTRLDSVPEIAVKAAELGRTLHNVRHSGLAFPVASGRMRQGKRLLTVGTDCAIGKKYAALAIARGLKARGVAADFRATGQTGIMIAGGGVALDAVVSDFLAGAAECLSPDAAADHWDVIEGQGSLFHPAYAAVTVGLINGSQPDALVLCHEPGRPCISDFPDYPLPPLDVAIPRYLDIARLTNPAATFVGVSLNTSAFAEDEARALCAEIAGETGLPATDPLRFGVEPILERVLACG